MIETVLQLAIAPVLVAAATLVGGRCGGRAAGVVSAFPAIVGPVLLVVAEQQGRRVAATAAGATLLGLVSLSAFAVAYGRAAMRGTRRWPMSLAAGWAAAAACGLAVALAGRDVVDVAGVAAAVGALSLWSARRALPAFDATPVARAVSRCELGLRMLLAAVLVAILAAAAAQLGPVAGGALAALPVLASVLAVFTHRRDGGLGAVGLLQGTLGGMVGFMVFCELVALLVVPAGIAAAFGAATVTAMLVHAAALTGRGVGIRGL